MSQLQHLFAEVSYLLKSIVPLLVLTFINISYCSNQDLSPNEFIQQQILKLKPDSFNEDPIFEQETYPANKSTVYFYTNPANGLKIPVFVRNGLLDHGIPVVVLQEQEDRLRSCGNKTTFVVLRRKDDKGKIYSAAIAYITKSPHGQHIEWDNWDDRGLLSDVNKAALFGWTKCSFSSLVPCKLELQTVLPGNVIQPRPIAEKAKSSNIDKSWPDYFCDLKLKGNSDGKFVGSAIDTLTNSMVILSGVQIMYQNEDNLVAEVAKDIKSVVPSAQVKQTGKSFFGNATDPEARNVASEIGAKKLLEKGREGIASAVLMFDSSISNIGAIASGFSMDSILSKASDLVQDKDKNSGQMSKLGNSLLRGLFEGASTDDKDEKFINPNPKALLKPEVIDDLVSLRKISSDRFLGRLFGFSFWGSSEEKPKPKPSPIGVPLNVTVGTAVVTVFAIEGGIVFNERFMQGKVVPNDSGELKFIPAGSPPDFANKVQQISPPPGQPSLESLRQKIMTSSDGKGINRSDDVIVTVTDSSPTPTAETLNNTGLSVKPNVTVGYTFYIDNLTSSATPLIAYIAPHGFLFYGLFFPGNVVDTNVIEIHGEVFLADPIERSQIRRGLMYPPMPPVYIVNQGQNKVSYFVKSGFLTETYFVEGEEVEGGVGYGEFFYNATQLPQQSAPIMPGMAGAYYIEINSKPYLAYVVHQGVLLAGSFFPAKCLMKGLEIEGVLYPGSYLNFVAVKRQERYKVTNYFDLIKANISNIFEKPVVGCIEFSQMYFKNTAFLKEGEIDTGIGATGPTIVKCSPGQTLVAPLGLSTEVAVRIMERDPIAEMVDWKQHVKSGDKSGSKAVDNLANVFSNSFDWKNNKSAGETFQENLVSGLWTPFGLADDIVDTVGHYTGAGKVSDDYGYIDDLFGAVFSGASVVGGVAGKIVDGVGSVLSPIGLGGVWRSIAGLTSGAIGIVGGVEATKVYGAYDLIKVGAKTVHLGWLLGLRGSESEKKKQELEEKITKLQNVRAYLLAHPPKCEVIQFGQVPGGVGAGVSLRLPESDINVDSGADFRGKRLAETEGNTSTSLVIVTDVDLFSHVGWRTLHIKQADLPNFHDIQEEPFVGIGACDHKKLMEQELNEAKSPKEILDFYMRSMGTQCLLSQKEALMDLIKFKHIQTTPEKTFVINKELGMVAKMTSEDTEILSKAFEISTYSQTYVQILKLKEPSHRNTLFLRKFVVNYIHQVQTSGKSHYIKLIRNLIKTLQTLYTKSLQDFYRFKYCPKCQEEVIRRLMNDPLEIISLLEYVATFSHSVLGYTSTQIEKDFETWVLSKKEEMQNKLQSYLV